MSTLSLFAQVRDNKLVQRSPRAKKAVAVSYLTGASRTRLAESQSPKSHANMTDKKQTKDHQGDIPDDNASQATTLVPDTNSGYYRKQVEAAAFAGLKWGITPKKLHDRNAIPDPDHPVHKIPAEKQEKMRKKGINPVLYAEMNQNKLNGKGTFWWKVSQTAMGGGCIK
ncbi:uncharacterized protein TRUGW13939_10453 [Talaromyces rugulosus]|uniref:Uncharacterized protein n=1 Tax=Talaromyces rugulosus TaxID=121627 RepID=A0A7H8RA31_TALRU|nr:uncharacterized protein TRUGW13939_10453 [Talaromyces rugulosus]QKX63284.1 hypothetical protein TRUGW13939_10453 [Talaromyces rugulosus]